MPVPTSGSWIIFDWVFLALIVVVLIADVIERDWFQFLIAVLLAAGVGVRIVGRWREGRRAIAKGTSEP